MPENQARPRATRWYIYGLVAVSMAALGGWVYDYNVTFNWASILISGILAAVSVVSLRLPVSFNFGKSTFDAVDVAILVMLVLGGPFYALLVAIPAMYYKDRLRMLFNASSLTLEILAAGCVFNFFSKPLLFNPSLDDSIVYGVIGAGFTLYTVNALVGSTLLWIKYETSATRLFLDIVLPLVPAGVVSILTTFATSYAAIRLGPVAAITLFGGAALSLGLMSFTVKRQRRLAELEEENGQLRERTGELESSLSESHLDFAWRLLESLGRRDGYTARHAAAAAVYATDLAEEFRMDDRTASRLRVAALLQDVGMVSVPEEVSVAPPERLNELGREKLESHPEESERILSGIPGMDEAAKWVRWHHERVDGTGYPDGLRGEWLPLEARILAVASHYASLVLERRNSPALDPSEARREIITLSGRAFDPLVVRTLLRVLDQNGEDYASATGERFAGALSDMDGGPIEKHGGLRVIGGGKTPAS